MNGSDRLAWVWDYDIDSSTFDGLLAGAVTLGRLDRRWAAVRLLEYAPWPEIVRRLGFKALVDEWPSWRSSVRSVTRRRGVDFVVEWVPRHRPELVA